MNTTITEDIEVSNAGLAVIIMENEYNQVLERSERIIRDIARLQAESRELGKRGERLRLALEELAVIVSKEKYTPPSFVQAALKLYDTNAQY